MTGMSRRAAAQCVRHFEEAVHDLETCGHRYPEDPALRHEIYRKYENARKRMIERLIK